MVCSNLSCSASSHPRQTYSVAYQFLLRFNRQQATQGRGETLEFDKIRSTLNPIAANRSIELHTGHGGRAEAVGLNPIRVRGSRTFSNCLWQVGGIVRQVGEGRRFCRLCLGRWISWPTGADHWLLLDLPVTHGAATADQDLLVGLDQIVQRLGQLGTFLRVRMVDHANTAAPM